VRGYGLTGTRGQRTIYIGKGEQFDAGAMKALPAGSFMVMPPNTPHFAMAKEEATAQIHGTGPWASTYVNPQTIPARSEEGRSRVAGVRVLGT